MTASENLRNLAENATPGPWTVGYPDYDQGVEYRHVTLDAQKDLQALWQTPEDAALIAAAPDAVGLLARALDALAGNVRMCECYTKLDDNGEFHFTCNRCAILADADRLFGNDTEKEER